MQFVGVVQRQFVASVVHSVLGQLVHKKSPCSSGKKAQVCLQVTELTIYTKLLVISVIIMSNKPL